MIAVIVLCILVSFFGGIYVSREFFSKKVVNENNDVDVIVKDEGKEDKIMPLSQDEKDLLLEQIGIYNKTLSKYYPLEGMNNIPNQEKLYFAMINSDVSFEWFLKSDLDKTLVKYFGSDNGVIHENIICPVGDGVLYKYNDATSKYEFSGTHGHGGGGLYNFTNYYISGTKKGDIYTVKVKVLYSNHCGDICGPATNYYKNASDSYNKVNSIYDVSDSEIETLKAEDVYNNVSEQLPVTTYSFKKDTLGNYGLVSVLVD